MMAGIPLVTGSAVKQVMKELLADPTFSTTYQTAKIEVANSGEWGYSLGTYLITSTNRKTKSVVKETGKSLTVYHKQVNGSWKIIDDVTTPDASPAPFENAK